MPREQRTRELEVGQDKSAQNSRFAVESADAKPAVPADSSSPKNLVDSPRRVPTAVALVGQVGVYRDALGRALGLIRDLRVAVTATPAHGAVQRVLEAADVIVLDARGLDSHAARELLTPRPTTDQILLIVDLRDREVVRAGAALGVKAFFSQERELSDLIEAIRVVANGGFYCPPEITGILLSQLESAFETSAVDKTLTRRESEVTGLLARGFSNKEIARTLGIALPTVKNHVHAILEKLNARNRTEAVIKLRA